MQSFDPKRFNQRPEPNKLKVFLKETGLFLADILYNAVVIIILVVLIRSFIISPFRVVGSSMADTLDNKEFILINKFSYLIGDIQRGDPVVFLPPSTSKDSPKLEEVTRTNESGSGTFDFSGLSKKKDTAYCNNAFFGSLWICRDHVTVNDLVYYAPLEDAEGSSAKWTNWGLVRFLPVDKEVYRQGFIAFDGTPNTPYTIRVYSSKGPEYFVKRIIGVPGDKVKIDGGRVYLKGPEDDDFRQIDESFLNAENLNRTYVSQRSHQNIYEVPGGHYFVMGDNRNHSNDSRSWLEPITQESFPFVSEANISGKVMVVLWPMTHFRFLGSADF